MRELAGIQTRTDSSGATRARAYVKQAGKKVYGPWGTVADAKAWRARAAVAKLDGVDLRPQRGETIAQAAERFLAGAKSGLIRSRRRAPYAPKTVRGYEQAFRDYINPEIGHIAVGALRRDQVQRWVDWVHSHVADGTTRNTWAALAALYRYLLPRNHELADPTDGIELPAPGKPRERYADLEEMAALLEALPITLALPYALAFYAGLRRAEIQALRWCDVEDEWIIVRRAMDPVEGFKTTKSGKERLVPLFARLRPFLECARLPYQATPGFGETLVVPSRRASRWGTQMLGTPYTRKCAGYWHAAGLEPIGLHEARHSFATALIHVGYNVRKVQAWVGHTDPSTTLRIYVKHEEREAGAARLMDDYLCPSGT